MIDIKDINFKDAHAALILLKFIEFCKTQEDFNSRDKFMLNKAYFDYMDIKE